MGDANRRGPPEVRIAQGIARRASIEEDRRKKLAIEAQKRREEFDALPERVKKRRRDGDALIATVIAMAAGTFVGSNLNRKTS